MMSVKKNTFLIKMENSGKFWSNFTNNNGNKKSSGREEDEGNQEGDFARQ